MGQKKMTEKIALEPLKNQFEAESRELKKMYSASFLVRKGQTVDTNRPYQEVYAEYIYNHLENDSIPSISIDEKNYCRKARQEKNGKGEERIQRDFYFRGKSTDKKLGKCIWFELDVHRNGKGIDLVFFNDVTNELGIVELKYENDGEPLLRPVVELQTYYQRINWEKALEGLRKWVPTLPQRNEITIKKYLMLDKGSRSCADFDLITQQEGNSESYVKKLMKAFAIEVIPYQ